MSHGAKIVVFTLLMIGFAFGSTPTNAQVCTPPPSGLISWYRGEGSVTDTQSGNNGSLLGGATYATGYVGQAFNFDGIDDSATIPNAANLNPVNLTLDAWVNFASLNTTTVYGNPQGTQYLIHKQNARSGGQGLFVSYSLVKGRSAGLDRMYFCMASNSGNEICVASTTLIAAGQWYHVAATYDNLSAKMYINGVLETTVATSQPLDYADKPVTLGRTGDVAFDGLLNGKLDEPSIYGRALDAGEIQTIFNVGAFGKCLSCAAAPVGMVDLYSGENDAIDSRSRNNGTLVNGATFGSGKVGQAFNFDGIDDNVDLGNWFTYTDFTLSMWVKPGATQVQYADIVDNNHTCCQNWVLQQDNFSTNVYAFSGSNNFTLAADVWQHLVVTHDATNVVKVYVNGVVVSTGTFAIPYNGTQFLRLGRWGNSLGLPSNRNWNGQIDEFAVFDRAISASEVQSIYDSGSAGMCKPTATTSPNGLAGWWAGDGDATDVSGNGNNGTLQNGAGFAVSKVGQGFTFDGVDDRMIVPASSSLDVGTANGFSIESWINPASSTNQQPIFEWNSGGPAAANQGVNLWMSVTFNGGVVGNLSANIRDTGGGPHLLETPSAVMAANEFQHVVLTYDKTTGAAQIFRNAILVASGNLGSFPPQTSFDLYFGNRPSVLNFQGKMDESAVYNRALTQAEIQSIYNAGSAGKLKSTPTGNSMFSFWKGEGTASDSVGTNGGSLDGGATTGTGVVGQGFVLDGNDDQITIPNAANVSFGPTSPMSVELWVYRTSGGNLQHIFGKRNNCDGSPINYQMAYFNNQIYFGSGGGGEITSGQDLPLNTWTHLAGTFDGTTLRIYMNGVLKGSLVGTLGGTNSAPFLIGGSGTCARFGGSIDEVAIYNRALSPSEIRSIYQTPTHLAGSAGDATVTFQNITAPGMTQETPLDLAVLPSLPMGVGSPGLTYDIATSASYTGNVGLCFNVPSLTAINAANLRIYHLEAGAWVNRTAPGATHSALCTTGVTSLSPFAVGILAPSAAGVSVSGRVTTESGRGIRNAVLTLSGTDGVRRVARTGSFGYYRFEDVPAGETYILSIATKRFTFSNPTRVISAADDVADADFVAVPAEQTSKRK